MGVRFLPRCWQCEKKVVHFYQLLGLPAVWSTLEKSSTLFAFPACREMAHDLKSDTANPMCGVSGRTFATESISVDRFMFPGCYNGGNLVYFILVDGIFHNF